MLGLLGTIGTIGTIVPKSSVYGIAFVFNILDFVRGACFAIAYIMFGALVGKYFKTIN